MSDRILGGLAMILGVAFIWGATLIETGFIVDPLGPRAFPIIIGGLMFAAGLYPLLRPDPEPAWPIAARAGEILIAVVLLIAYAQLLEPLGFGIATAIAAAILSWRLGSNLIWAAVIGVGISASIYVIFKVILGLSLARGPLGF